MGGDLAVLIMIFFLILLARQAGSTTSTVSRDFLFVLFEFCSAYGTAGLSMSNQAYSASADWGPWAQVLLMLVMVMGRLRGLPDAIDQTFMLEGLTGRGEDSGQTVSVRTDSGQAEPVHTASAFESEASSPGFSIGPNEAQSLEEGLPEVPPPKPCLGSLAQALPRPLRMSLFGSSPEIDGAKATVC
jgi:hypothetical protein